MSQNPDEPREDTSEDKSFESGLDYGAFASAEPDFPEDHLGEESSRNDDDTAQPTSEPAAGVPAPADRSTDDREAQPTEMVPPVDRQQSDTRSLSDESSAAPSATSADRVDAQSATTGAPAAADEQRTTALPREHSPAQRTASPAVSTASPVTPRHQRSPDQPAATARRDHSAVPPNEDELQEEVEKDKRGVSRFFTVLIAIFTPLMFAVLAIRLVASPIFLMFTYWRPGFPADPGGWDLRERLLYGSYGTDFLLNAADSRYLAQLAPNGEPLFTDDEVAHMADVKILLWYAMIIGVGLLLLTLLMALLLRSWRPGGLARGVFAGAWATIGLMIAVAVLAIVDWQLFFTEFHNLFFPQGNWSFPSDSTLIRLYPEQFWIDAGIWLAALLLIFSILALLITWPTKRRRARRADRLAEVRERKRAKLEDELNKAAADS
jgi:integral membrane protein (TIGR01906 family)